MTAVTSAKFEELALQVEFDPDGSPGVYTLIAGLKDVTINRASTVDTTEVPDATDESLPFSEEKAVRSQQVSVTADGTWALESHTNMLDWWRGGATLNAKVVHKVANDSGATGDIIEEAGPALLTRLDHSRTKGQKVTSAIEFEFDGVPPVALKT